MPLTAYGADFVANHYISSHWWLALCWATPDSGSTGATLSEVSAVDYSRVHLTPANWAPVNHGLSYYTQAISLYPISNWGSINSWALTTSSTVGLGNVVSYGNFSPSVTVVAGGYVNIQAGLITVGVEY